MRKVFLAISAVAFFFVVGCGPTTTSPSTGSKVTGEQLNKVNQPVSGKTGPGKDD